MDHELRIVESGVSPPEVVKRSTIKIYDIQQPSILDLGLHFEQISPPSKFKMPSWQNNCID